MGRPKKEVPSARIYVRVEQDELEMIDRLCAKLGLKERSALIRMAIREFLQKFYQRDIWDILREKVHQG